MSVEEVTGRWAADAEPAFATPWLTVRSGVWSRDGRDEVWHFLDHPGCALVLPLTSDGRVVLIRVWRPTVGTWVWELPCGRIEPGESPDRAAVRELAEEVGGRGGALEPLGVVLASSGSSNERVHVFVAAGVELGTPEPDEGELVTTHVVTASQAYEMALAGRILDGPAALAILWAAARGHMTTGKERLDG